MSCVDVITFEDGSDLPHTDGPGAVKLAEDELHEEERNGAEDHHEEIGDEEGAWNNDVDVQSSGESYMYRFIYQV